MSVESPLIALISATPVAIPPATAAVGERIPAARVWNLLDDRLLVDAEAAGGLNKELTQRMMRLIQHALDGGADGVLLTCSQYGSVARSLPVHPSAIPVLAADDAAFDAVVEGRFDRVLVLASLESALADTTARLREQLDNADLATQIVGAVVAGAGAAAATGDVDKLTELFLDAAGRLTDVDAVLLAQYSLAPAHAALSASLGLPVFAGPDLAARLLLTRLVTR
jgi:hypothetical protein